MNAFLALVWLSEVFPSLIRVRELVPFAKLPSVFVAAVLMPFSKENRKYKHKILKKKKEPLYYT